MPIVFFFMARSPLEKAVAVAARATAARTSPHYIYNYCARREFLDVAVPHSLSILALRRFNNVIAGAASAATATSFVGLHAQPERDLSVKRFGELGREW
jgi:hypothetical protein